jgi:hypothetical protein
LAALGRHAGPEAVTALAHQFARLIGPLHDTVSAISPLIRTVPGPSAAMRPDLRIPAKKPSFRGRRGSTSGGLIREPPGPVKCNRRRWPEPAKPPSRPVTWR